MHTYSIHACIEGLRAKNFSAEELTAHFLQRIEQYDSQLNSFITVNPDALQTAKKADEALAQGDAPRLTGVPIGQKDIFCTKHLPTTCASRMLENFVSPYEATSAAQLREAGTILMGKINMDEFAMGSSNENSAFGPCKNPWDLSRVPGGSSGGSAAAVAARLIPGCTGTDTGGSIRQPAAFCGITGIKPTYGRVSRYGMIAFASSLDQGGPMAGSAQDCAYLLEGMAGHDPRDASSCDLPVPSYVDDLAQPLKPLTIGLPAEFFSNDLDPQIAECIDEARQILEKLGHQFKEVHLPNSSLAIPTYYILAPSEASSNLARFDGVRYGHSTDHTDTIDHFYENAREAFGTEVKRRILIGTFALSSGFYGSFYRKAQKMKMLIANDFEQAFESCDLILGPITPTVAYRLGEKTSDPVSMYLGDIFSIPANLAQLPALSMPGGMIDGLPVGIQLIGPRWQEGLLLQAAHAYQQVTDWHQRIPDLFQA